MHSTSCLRMESGSCTNLHAEEAREFDLHAGNHASTNWDAVVESQVDLSPCITPLTTSPACRQAMCRCMLGTPAGIAQRVDNFQRNAKLTFQMWQNQEQLFTPQAQPSVDIPLPRLLRKSVSEPAPVQPPPGALAPTESLSCLLLSLWLIPAR